MIEPKITEQQIHRAVRNILFNELGLSREGIEQIVRDEVEKITERTLEHHLLGGGWFSQRVLYFVTNILKNGYRKSEYHQSNISFEDYIMQEVKAQVKERVLNNFKFKIVLED
jgi:hypothetical protein